MMSMQTDLFEASSAPRAGMIWTPTREAGLARLADFVPRAGKAYAHARNSDFGPEDRSNISCLSPYLARRLITEEEVVTAVLRRHSFVAAEKFIQEVFWRTYWKGWLEMRPSVLVAFNQSRLKLRAMADNDPDLADALHRAQTGQTGIACFDAWAHELRTYGWLHNHARMWFASIWIFTLELPWQLGADFFYKHLLDADVASNTLSWRWVAGLHTKGKHYVARASNIATHTNHRFDPAGQLNEQAQPLSETYQAPAPSALPVLDTAHIDRVGLLITQEDLCPQQLHFGEKIMGAAIMSMPAVGEQNSQRHLFDAGALADAATRASNDFGVDVETYSNVEEIVAWALGLDVREIVTPYAPTGLVAWQLSTLGAKLAHEGIKLVQVRRDWDSRAWPIATGGFFKLKEKLPSLIQGLVPK
jgi:deoxyribodipyrimidine photo-lyase